MNAHVEKLNRNSQIAIGWSGHLTESHQLKAADALIAKLRLELGQEKSYVEELLEQIEELKQTKEVESLQKENECLRNEISALKEENKKWSMKYSNDVQEVINTDLLYARAHNTIKSLSARIEQLTKDRDSVIYQLNILRDERNN